MTERKKNILKNMAAYGLSRNISQVIGFFTAVLMRNFLGPLYMGIWSLIRVLFSYTAYSELGALQSVYYKVPLFNGKGEKEKAETVQNVVFSFLVCICVVVSVLTLLAAFILKSRMPKELFVGLVVFPGFFTAQRLYTYFVMLLRANKKFVTLGKTTLFDSSLNLLMVVLLVGKFKLYGLYAATILLPLLDMLFIRHNIKFHIKFKIVTAKIKEYVKFGFPIFVSAMSMIMLYSIDRIMIAKWLGLVPLGYYSIAVMMRTYSTELSNNFASVLSPYFIEDYGKTGDASGVGHSIAKYTEIISCVMAIILGIAYIALPVFVNYVMPRFVPGINAMKAMLFCSFFMVISGHLRNFLVMKEKQKLLMKITFVGIVINILLNYAAVRGGFGITGVAIASSISAFLLFMGISIFALGYIKGLPVYRFMARVFAPFAYSISVLFVIQRFVTQANPINEGITRLLLFLAAAVVVLIYIDRRTKVAKLFIEVIKERFVADKPANEEVTYG